MKHPTLLYAICDGGRGKFFFRRPHQPKLQEGPSFEAPHSPGGLRERELFPVPDWQQAEKDSFCRLIAQEVNKSFAAKEFDKLVLVAPVRVLQDIRQELTPPVHQALAEEIQKDLTKFSTHELEDLLPKTVSLLV